MGNHFDLRFPLAVLLAVNTVAAPPTRAAPKAPSTTPTSQPTDSPRLALRQLVVAFVDGEPNRCRAAMHADTARENKVVDAMAAVAASIGKLRSATAAQFGEGAANRLVILEGFDEIDAELSKAKVNVSMDVATVEIGEARFMFVRVNQKWAIDVGAFLKSANLPAEDILRNLTQTADYMDYITLRVSKGEFKTVAEVSDAVKGVLWFRP